MSTNKYVPHVLVLPEDDANNSIVNGFLLHDALDQRAIQILPCAGGWTKVRETFQSDYIPTMYRYPNRHIVMLVDFDDLSDRFEEMAGAIPDDVKDRVFVIGVLTEPEDLRRAGLGNIEEVGHKLAEECFDEIRTVWEHDLLRHNAPELVRMTTHLRSILFPDPPS